MVKDEQESFSMLIIAVRGSGREVVDRVRMSAVSPTNERSDLIRPCSRGLGSSASVVKDSRINRLHFLSERKHLSSGLSDDISIGQTHTTTACFRNEMMKHGERFASLDSQFSALHMG